MVMLVVVVVVVCTLPPTSQPSHSIDPRESGDERGQSASLAFLAAE